MFELSWHHVHVRAESRTFFVRQAESRTLPYLFTFERSREPCPTCLCSSEVENPDTMFMFERSREPCATCLRSSGVENLVYVRAFLTPCLRSSGVENLALPVYVRAESRTFLTPCLSSSEAENPALLVYVRAESRTFCYASGVENPALLFSLFMFERSREPSWHLVYVRSESRTPFRIVHQNSIFES